MSSHLTVTRLSGSGKRKTIIAELTYEIQGLRRYCSMLLDQAGTLTVPVSQQFPLSKANFAHREIETGHTCGKIASVTT